MSTLSAILLVGFLQGLIVVVNLLFSKANRAANFFLAGLIFLVSLKLVPYILGFSGYYQRFPWLSYAPLELETGFGPLLYLYVAALTRQKIPAYWRLHLVPLAIEAAYYSVMFCLPLSFRNDWHPRVQVHVDVFDTYFSLLSMAIYLVFALRRVREYRGWTAENQSQGDPVTIRFLHGILLAFGVTVLLDTTFQLLASFIPARTYLDSYAFYLWITVLAYGLGTAALRFSERIPQETAAVSDVPMKVAKVERPPNESGKDWSTRAKEIERQVHDLRAWEDPSLSLEALADRLAIPPSQLSKAINQGLGESFSGFVNRLRIAQVSEALRDETDKREILDLAFEAGFNSKASFNRCFKQVTGESPSEYRRRHRSSGA